MGSELREHMAILQSEDHLLSFVNVANVTNDELMMDIADTFEQFHHRIGHRLQNIIVVLASPVELYQANYFYFF